VHRAGCRALWLGVEDMTATLVKKGQNVSKTTEVFGRLRDAGICPMPMMVHHDSQPLFSHGSDYGLLNQVRRLRKAGAVTLQVLMMTWRGWHTLSAACSRALRKRWFLLRELWPQGST
jgi:hypothetical protein